MAPPRKYSPELRERAVRMVFELREQTGVKTGTIARVADQLGVHREALRTWVRQVEVDGGQRPGTTTSDAQRIAELERENREPFSTWVELAVLEDVDGLGQVTGSVWAAT